MLVCTFLHWFVVVLHAPKAPLVKGSWRGAPEGLPRRSEKKAPLAGELSPKVTERLYQICSDLSVSASPSHLPWKGRLWDCALQRLPL